MPALEIKVSEPILKPGQNQKCQKKFLGFFNLAAEKKDSRNSGARKIFGPSYFLTALVR